MDYIRKGSASYRKTRTSDPDMSKPAQHVMSDDDDDLSADGEGAGSIQMTQEDIMRAMAALQGDDSVPQGTRDLINQISNKFLHDPAGGDHYGGAVGDAYASSSPLGSDVDDAASMGIHTPTGSEGGSVMSSSSQLPGGGPRLSSNPKTMEALKQITVLLQGVAVNRQMAQGNGSTTGSVKGGSDLQDRDFLHAKGLAAFGGGHNSTNMRHGAYDPMANAAGGPNITVMPMEGMDTSLPNGASTPTNYQGAKNPQDTKYHPSRNFLIGVSAINFVAGVLYIYWRCTRSMLGVMGSWFAWVFLIGEAVITISAWQSHCSRFFPVKRTRCTMDELVKVDRTLSGRSAVTIFMPTAGESLSVLRQALMSNLSMRLWPSELDACNNLRIIVLDEKRRVELICLVALCYKFASIYTNDPQIKPMLKKDRVPDLSIRGFFKFYEQCAAQFGRKWHSVYTEAFAVAAMIEKLCLENKIPDAWDGIELPCGKRVEASLVVENGRMPRLREDFDEVPNIPSVIYYCRRNPGEPAISPKAGNMNSVLFPEDPVDDDIINGARFVVINDARHAFEPEYLQRVVPYFFELKKVDGKYKYQLAPRVAFIQVPQRFRDRGDGDPFGNRSAVMFDVTNIGRDGVGGVMSCGQGSIWRVDVIRDGITADGKKSVDPLEVRSLVGTKLGYSQLSRIEDTMTSIGLFSKGFKSVYVNEENEHLGWCTQEPDTMDWRIKQLFRWHYGAVELFSMGPFRLQEGRFPTLWHRIYVWEACTYFFQALSAQIFLFMPIWYCFTWEPPFTTYKTEFIGYLIPYFLTAILPTMIGLGWRKVNPDLALREEQVWMATAYVQLYAFISSIFQRIKRATTALAKDANAASNWNIDCPTWPLYGVFAAEVAAAIVTSVRWFRIGFEQPWVWMSSFGGACMAIWMLWPVVIKGLKLPALSKFYMRYMALAGFIVIVSAWQKA